MCFRVWGPLIYFLSSLKIQGQSAKQHKSHSFFSSSFLPSKQQISQICHFSSTFISHFMLNFNTPFSSQNILKSSKITSKIVPFFTKLFSPRSKILARIISTTMTSSRAKAGALAPLKAKAFRFAKYFLFVSAYASLRLRLKLFFFYSTSATTFRRTVIFLFGDKQTFGSSAAAQPRRLTFVFKTSSPTAEIKYASSRFAPYGVFYFSIRRTYVRLLSRLRLLRRRTYVFFFPTKTTAFTAYGPNGPTAFRPSFSKRFTDRAEGPEAGICAANIRFAKQSSWRSHPRLAQLIGLLCSPLGPSQAGPLGPTFPFGKRGFAVQIPICRRQIWAAASPLLPAQPPEKWVGFGGNPPPKAPNKK